MQATTVQFNIDGVNVGHHFERVHCMFMYGMETSHAQHIRTRLHKFHPFQNLDTNDETTEIYLSISSLSIYIYILSIYFIIINKSLAFSFSTIFKVPKHVLFI